MNVAGKTVIAVTGFIWGLVRSLQTPQTQAGEASPVPGSARLSELDGRLARIEATLDRLVPLGGSAEGVPAGVPRSAGYVTHEELTKHLGQAEKRMETKVAEQFSHQMLAIGSLRAMIVDTDTLLERVLSRLESSAGDTSEHAAALPDDEPLFMQENLRGARKNPISTLPG